MRIGIAGAGIGGLAAAALLADRGHAVTLFDQWDTPRPVGSGLVIQPVGQEVLDLIGAGHAAKAKGARISRMLGHEADSGRRVLDVSYARKGQVSHGLAIHRASLFAALFEAVTARAIPIETGFKVAGRDGMFFVDARGGRSARFDLLVDASGANSTLAQLKSRALPYGAIWGTVNWPEHTVLRSDWLTQRYQKASHMIGALPIGTLPGDATQKAAVFWSLPAEDEAKLRAKGVAAWRDHVLNLWPDYAPFAEQITDLDQLTMARYSHGTLARPYDDGLAIIGDAAHRASPQLGQGANMALLDAYALARALEVAKGQRALRLYAGARRWHVRVYQAFSKAFTPQYQSDSHVLPWLRDNMLFPLSTVPPIPAVLNRLVCGDMFPPIGRGLIVRRRVSRSA